MESNNLIKLNVPPEGKVEAQVTGPTSMIRWAPGNGLVYQLLATPVSDEIKKVIGGGVTLSIMRRDGRCYTMYPGNLTGLYHHSFVAEKWGEDLGEEGTMYVTALLNWALYDDDISSRHAADVFQQAKQRWK